MGLSRPVMGLLYLYLYFTHMMVPIENVSQLFLIRGIIGFYLKKPYTTHK
jgi:hypothetical protein